jgi:hypothetical protein
MPEQSETPAPERKRSPRPQKQYAQLDMSIAIATAAEEICAELKKIRKCLRSIDGKLGEAKQHQH